MQKQKQIKREDSSKFQIVLEEFRNCKQQLADKTYICNALEDTNNKLLDYLYKSKNQIEKLNRENNIIKSNTSKSHNALYKEFDNINKSSLEDLVSQSVINSTNDKFENILLELEEMNYI